MKKVTKVVTGVLLSAGIFAAGTVTGANGGWSNEVVTDANKQLGSVGYQKKEQLVDEESIKKQIKDSLTPEIQKQQAELEKMLEDYYQMKLDGLQDTPEYQRVKQQIEDLKISIFNRYKKEIDQAFEAQ